MVAHGIGLRKTRIRLRKWSPAVASKNASFHDGHLAAVLLSPLKVAFSLRLVLVAILLVAWIVGLLPQAVRQAPC